MIVLMVLGAVLYVCLWLIAIMVFLNIPILIEILKSEVQQTKE